MKKNTLDQLFQKAAEGQSESPNAEAWSKIVKRIQPESKKKIVYWPKITVAACLLLVGIGVWLSFNNSSKPQNNTIVASKKNALPKKTQPTITQKIEIIAEDKGNLAATNLNPTDNKKPKNKASQPFKLKKKLNKPLNIFNNQGALRSIDIVAKNENIMPKGNQEIKELPVTVIAENTITHNNNIESPAKADEPFTLLVKMGVTQTAMLEPTETPVAPTEQVGFLKKVWKQYKNVKEGEPVKWKNFGIKPNKILAKAEGKIRGQ